MSSGGEPEPSIDNSRTGLLAQVDVLQARIDELEAENKDLRKALAILPTGSITIAEQV